jgi:4'-phosphopantetheinyl transferase
MDPLLAIRWSPPRLPRDERERAIEVLSDAERSRLAIEPGGRAEAFLAGRALLRELAGELLGVDPAAVPLSAPCPDCGREHGRPRIIGSDLRVSLSHGADAVVTAAVGGARVGIDVESATAVVADLAPLIPHPTLVGWTRIEAVLKADGRGLRVDPGAVRFTETEHGVVGWVDGSAIRYRVHEVDVMPSMCVSVAVETR